MSSFLQQEGESAAFIDEVAKLILATKIGYLPQNTSEKIIKDADCAHFGNENYQQISDDLRKEWELTGFRKYTDEQWNRENCNLLKNIHSYYTNFAKNKLQKSRYLWKEI